MRDPNRFPTAWHFTVLRRDRVWNGRLFKEGDVLQHYPIWARLQHGHSANILGPGGESEDGGIPGNELRLTAKQEDSWLRIHHDIEEYTGRKFLRVPGSRTGLVEHREMTTPPGGTSCPSNLYDNLWKRILSGDDDLSAQQYEELKKEILEIILRVYGSKERFEELKPFASLENRVNRMEMQDGWLDAILDDHEERIVNLESAEGSIPHEHRTGPPIHE